MAPHTQLSSCRESSVEGRTDLPSLGHCPLTLAVVTVGCPWTSRVCVEPVSATTAPWGNLLAAADHSTQLPGEAGACRGGRHGPEARAQRGPSGHVRHGSVVPQWDAEKSSSATLVAVKTDVDNQFHLQCECGRPRHVPEMQLVPAGMACTGHPWVGSSASMPGSHSQGAEEVPVSRPCHAPPAPGAPQGPALALSRCGQVCLQEPVCTLASTWWREPPPDPPPDPLPDQRAPGPAQPGGNLMGLLREEAGGPPGHWSPPREQVHGLLLRGVRSKQVRLFLDPGWQTPPQGQSVL